MLPFNIITRGESAMVLLTFRMRASPAYKNETGTNFIFGTFTHAPTCCNNVF
jgi:hypothetical protein